MNGEKALLQQHNNAASNIEQVPEATPQHPTKQQLYGHLPPFTKTIKVDEPDMQDTAREAGTSL